MQSSDIKLSDLKKGMILVSDSSGLHWRVEGTLRRDPNSPIVAVVLSEWRGEQCIGKYYFGFEGLEDLVESYGIRPRWSYGCSDGDSDSGAEAQDSMGNPFYTGENPTSIPA